MMMANRCLQSHATMPLSERDECSAGTQAYLPSGPSLCRVGAFSPQRPRAGEGGRRPFGPGRVGLGTLVRPDRSSRPTRTSGLPRRSRTAARRSCDAGAPTPTVSTSDQSARRRTVLDRLRARSAAAARARSSNGSPRTTRSRSTSGTRAAGCLPCRPVCGSRASGSERRCSADGRGGVRIWRRKVCSLA